MAVEGEHLAVQFLCLLELSTLLNEPLEDGQHFGTVAKDVCLRMPLYAHNGLEFRALNGFDNSIGTHCCDLHAWGSLLASLMMEGVDSQFFPKEFLKEGTLCEAHLMGRITTVLVLAMLDADALHLGVDILIVGATQCSIDDLDALADTQHGNLTVIRQTSQ